MSLAIELGGDELAGQDLTALNNVIKKLNSVKPAKLTHGQVNIELTDDAGLRVLNKKYAQADYATDVLSFSYIEDGGEPIDGVIGDVAISVERAREQAKVAGTELATELALLGLHGVLHVLGYDHNNPADQSVMDALQAQIMASAGISYRDFAWVS